MITQALTWLAWGFCMGFGWAVGQWLARKIIAFIEVLIART